MEKSALIIETVKNYPVLYDTFHLDYKNNKLKKEIWKNIAEMIEESNGNAVKSRWKNLKDAYGKCLRANRARPVPKNVQRYKSWPWKENMSFLQPHLTFALTESDAYEPIDHKNIDPIIEESSQHPESSVHPNCYQKIEESGSPLLEYKHGRHKRMHESDQSDCDSQDNQVSSNNTMMEHDATDLIFLGYARTIKENMSKRRQAIVKFRIARIIMEAEFEQAEES